MPNHKVKLHCYHYSHQPQLIAVHDCYIIVATAICYIKLTNTVALQLSYRLTFVRARDFGDFLSSLENFIPEIFISS